MFEKEFWKILESRGEKNLALILPPDSLVVQLVYCPLDTCLMTFPLNRVLTYQGSSTIKKALQRLAAHPKSNVKIKP